MSDRMSDKKTDEPVAASGKGALAAAAKAAVEQGMQTAAKTTEAAATPVRETAAALPSAVARAGAVAQQSAQVAQQSAQIAKQSAQAGLEQTTSTLTTTMERAMTTAEEILSIGQGNIEAFVKSGQIWSSGLQDLGRYVAQSAQAQIDGTMSAIKAMTTVKSVHEAIELQSTMARNALEKAVLDSGKLTDASLKLAEQTMAPLTARVNYVAERFGRVAA